MQFRPLGSSGLLVSPVCLGTMPFGTPVGEEDAIRLVHGAIDLGISFIDTANIYEGYRRVLGSAGGVAEEITGRALRGKRDRVVLATKVGSPNGPGPNDKGLSATTILREVDHSLRRLQTDFIDLYIIHWPDRETPLEVTLSAIDIAVQAGKVRYFGVSNHAAWQICEFLWIADRRNQARVVSSQIPFSLLRREYQPDLEFCRKHAVGVTPYQSLQGGLLTGKYLRGMAPAQGSRAAEKPEWIWKTDAALFDKLEAIETVAQKANLSMTRLALAWTLAQPAVASVIVGVKTMAQIQEAVAAGGDTIDAGTLKHLDQICPPPWVLANPIRP